MRVHFIYVMSESDRDKMCALGYDLLKEAPKSNVWVFRAKDNMSFAEVNEVDRAGVSYVLSDVLTF